MPPIYKKFRIVDSIKNTPSSTTSPPSSPSVSSPPSVIVRNDCPRVDPIVSYYPDPEQVASRVSNISHHEKREMNVVSTISQQDLPIDATIGAKIDASFDTSLDTRNMAPIDSVKNDSDETKTQTFSFVDRDAVNSPASEFNGNNQVATLFSPVSPSSSLQHHSQEQNSAHCRSHSLHRHKHSEHPHYHHEPQQHSEPSQNIREAPLHHQIHNHLHLIPQHLNVHLLDHHHHHHHPSNVPNINSHCIIPSPSNSPFDQQVHPSTFPFSPTSSAPSLPPSPASVITENIGNHKESSPFSGPTYYDSNGIRTRADTNSNSEPFPYEKSSKSINSKRSNKSSPSSLISSETHSHHQVSFRRDNPSPTPSKSSTNSEGHKSSSLDKSSEEYRLRRERNNIAVRKSRSKSKVKFIQTIDRMNQLEEENTKLHTRIDEMSREITFLRLIFAKYHRENPRRLEHLEHLLAIEMSQEITLLDIGNNLSRARNYEDSRSNINQFFKER